MMDSIYYHQSLIPSEPIADGQPASDSVRRRRVDLPRQAKPGRRKPGHSPEHDDPFQVNFHLAIVKLTELVDEMHLEAWPKQVDPGAHEGTDPSTTQGPARGEIGA